MKAAMLLLAIMYDNPAKTSATVEIRDVIRGNDNAVVCFQRKPAEEALLWAEGKDPSLTAVRCMTQKQLEDFGVDL